MGRIRATSVAEWADACSNAFVPLKVRTGAPRFAATLDHVAFGQGVSVTSVASEGSEVYRSDRVIAANPRDDLLLSFHRAGAGRVIQHGRQARLRPGAAVLYDASAPYTLQFPGRMSEVVLQVPRRAVNRSGQALADLTARVLPGSASMTALTSLVSGLAASGGPERLPLEDELLGEAVTTLLQATLLPARRPGPARLDSAALGVVMRAYVDEHFADPDLSVERIAAAHHVSVRLVHTLFAEQGESPGAYLRRRRLSHARERLLRGATVTSAAATSGFGDTDTFTRAFKREFGEVPSALRG